MWRGNLRSDGIRRDGFRGDDFRRYALRHCGRGDSGDVRACDTRRCGGRALRPRVRPRRQHVQRHRQKRAQQRRPPCQFGPARMFQPPQTLDRPDRREQQRGVQHERQQPPGDRPQRRRVDDDVLDHGEVSSSSARRSNARTCSRSPGATSRSLTRCASNAFESPRKSCAIRLDTMLRRTCASLTQAR